MSDWVHVYTDSSADDVVRNGGAGRFIKYPNDQDISYLQEPTPPTIKQVEAIKKAAEILVDNTFTKVVILADALSGLQALEAEDKILNDLSTSLTLLCQEATVVL